MSELFQNHNIKSLFEKFQPEQRLVNLLFDKVMLKKVLRFSVCLIVGHAKNASQDPATSAVVIKMICHYGAS